MAAWAVLTRSAKTALVSFVQGVWFVRQPRRDGGPIAPVWEQAALPCGRFWFPGDWLRGQTDWPRCMECWLLPVQRSIPSRVHAGSLSGLFIGSPFVSRVGRTPPCSRARGSLWFDDDLADV